MKGRKLRVFLAAIVAIAFALVPCLVFADPAALPTATVTDAAVQNREVQLTGSTDTVVLGYEGTFHANEPSEETLAAYGDWLCDFTVSFDRDIAANSFGLYGAYQWSGGEEYGQAYYYPSEMQTGVPVYLLESADINGVTYRDVALGVTDFTCGVFNASAENVGATMTVNLVIWPEGDKSKAETIESKEYKLEPAPLPEATVTTVEAAKDVPICDVADNYAKTGKTADVEKQLRFTVVEPASNVLAYYGEWRAVYEVSFDNDVAADTLGLYGSYNDWNVGLVVGMDIERDTPVKLLESALGDSMRYSVILDSMESMDCGVFNLSEINNGTEMTAKLVMWDPNNERETKASVAEETYKFNGNTWIKPLPEADVADTGSVEGADVYLAKDKLLGTVNVEETFTFTPKENSIVDTPAYDTYQGWYADFAVSFSEDVPANSLGLYGSYGDYGDVALLMPETSAGDEVYLLKSFGLDNHLSYSEVVNIVDSFKCGAFNLSEGNKGTTMTVKLNLFQLGADGPINVYTVQEKDYTFGDPGLWTVDGKDYRYVDSGSDPNGKWIDFDNGTLIDRTEDAPHFSEVQLEEFTYNIALQDSIDINFHVKNLQDEPSSYTIEYSFDDKTKTETLANKDDNKFTIAECAARQMADEATVIVRHNDDIIKQATYSIKGYCESIIGDDRWPGTLVNLCKATLDYGRYAQEYFKYNTGNLANDGVDYFDNSAIIVDPEDAVTSGPCAGITSQSLSLVTTSRTQFVIYLKHEEGVKASDYTFTLDGEELDSESIEDRNNKFEIWVNGISAKNLGDAHTVTAKDSEGTVYSYSASPVRYMGIAIGAGNGVEVNRAIYNYYKTAKAYLG